MADWDAVADLYDRAYGDAVCRAENRILRRWLRQTDVGGPVIDLGSGTGLALDLLPGLTPRYLGVDISEHMIQVAKGKHPEGQFLHADLTENDTWWRLRAMNAQARLRARRGTAVICLFSFTEIDHPTRMLFRILELAPERTLIVAYGPGPPTHQMLELTGPPPTWTEAEFKEAAQRVGFRPIWIRGWRRVPEPSLPALTVPLEGLNRKSYHPPRYIAGLLA